MKRLVTIVGPTAIGKSNLAVELALLHNGEIIGADSRQVYRYMDIGTAKPSVEDRQKVPHHLVDFLEPDREFSLALYLSLVRKVINEIYSRGKLPFLVGGTGLYIRSIIEGWQIPEISPDYSFRYNKEIQAFTEEGRQKLYDELCRINPAVAAKIDSRNTRRIIRALEIQSHSEELLPESVLRKPPDFYSLVIGLTASRSYLYKMADQRVDKMIKNGLVDEVKMLLEKGYDSNLPSMSGIGYRQIIKYLNGEMSLDEAVSKIKTATHRFIRRQYNWFRLNDSRIHWFDCENYAKPEIIRQVSSLILEHGG